MASRKKGPFPVEELIKNPLPTALCVDMGAFYGHEIKEIPSWVDTVVLMSDRLPRLAILLPCSNWSGFLNFMWPKKHRNKIHTVGQWAGLYRTIAKTVHETGGELWAYDCLGLNTREALLHGVDYRLFAEAGLDVMKAFTPISHGRLIVWGNDLLSR